MVGARRRGQPSPTLGISPHFILTPCGPKATHPSAAGFLALVPSDPELCLRNQGPLPGAHRLKAEKMLEIHFFSQGRDCSKLSSRHAGLCCSFSIQNKAGPQEIPGSAGPAAPTPVVPSHWFPSQWLPPPRCPSQRRGQPPAAFAGGVERAGAG